MFKVIFFLWRRADFTREMFVDYYERTHNFLGTRLVPPRPTDYRRTYPGWSPEFLASGRTAVFGLPPFDVMTELWHEDRSGFEGQLQTVTRSPTKELMAEDEGKFMNRDQQILLIAEEHGRPAGAIDRQARTKLLRYARRSPGLAEGEFKARYEREVAPELARVIPGMVDYRRNYPLYDDPLSYVGGHHNPSKPGDDSRSLDLIEEIWLSASTDARAVDAQLASRTALLDATASLVTAAREFRSDYGRAMAPVADARAVD
jgi:hypothetical protein